MRFERIGIIGGQADTADPRAAPGEVPADHIKTAPLSRSGTDEQPIQVLLALEGTATQTADVQLFILDEPRGDFSEDNQPAAAERRFYALGTPVTLTVGVAQLVRMVPGPIYYRITDAPAANAVLKIAAVGA